MIDCECFSTERGMMARGPQTQRHACLAAVVTLRMYLLTKTNIAV